MSSAREGAHADTADVERLSAELGRLDAYSFFIVPAGAGSIAEVIVAGTTGVFLIAVEPLEGAFVGGGRPAVGGVRLRGLRALRVETKRLTATLAAGSVYVSAEPVVCLTRATVGAPRTIRGVRFVGLDRLARELAGRSGTLPRMRAQAAARLLGMRIAGDHRRHTTR